MKKLHKIVALALALTMVFAIPVLAEDDRSGTMVSSENTDEFVRLLDEHNNMVMGHVGFILSVNPGHPGEAMQVQRVTKQVKDYDILCCDNHKLYLKTVLSNAQQDLANKQTQYNNAVAQMAISPSYADLLPQCQAELVAAQQKVVDAQNRIAIADQKLAKYYNAITY